MKNIYFNFALLSVFVLAGALRAQPHVIIGPKNLLPAQTSADSLKFPQADGHGGTSWQTAASAASVQNLSVGIFQAFGTSSQWMPINGDGVNYVSSDATDTNNTAEAGAWKATTKGTLKNLRIQTERVPGANQGDTVEVYKNGVATAIKGTLAGASITKGYDLTHTVSVDSGDLVSYRYIKSSGSAGGVGVFSIEFDANSTLTSANFSGTSSGTNTGDVTLAGAGTYLTISGQQITQNAIVIKNFYSFAIEGVTQGRYYNPFQDINGGNTGTSSDPTDTTNGTIDWAWVIPKGGGTIKNLKIVTSGSPRGTDSVIAKFIKNGSATTLKATVKTGSNIADDQTHSISAVENDLVSVFFNYLSANGYVRYLTVTFEFDPNLFIHYYTGFREAMKGSHDVYEEILY